MIEKHGTWGLSYTWNSAAYIVTPVSPRGVPTRLLRNCVIMALIMKYKSITATFISI
jgi:hypothetical protein